jgi:hypothetical protein
MCLGPRTGEGIYPGEIVEVRELMCDCAVLPFCSLCLCFLLWGEFFAIDCEGVHLSGSEGVRCMLAFLYFSVLHSLALCLC